MYYGDIVSTDPQNSDVTYSDYYCVVPTRSSNIVDGYYQDATGNTSGFNTYTSDVEDGNFPFGSTIRTATSQTYIYCTIGQHDNVEFQSLFHCAKQILLYPFVYGNYRAMTPSSGGVWLMGQSGYINSGLKKSTGKNFLAFGFNPTTYVYTCADLNRRTSGSTVFTPNSSNLGVAFLGGNDFAEVRAKKTLSSKEMLRFQYFNLTEPENVYTIKKPSKRRRRSAIIDFI